MGEIFVAWAVATCSALPGKLRSQHRIGPLCIEHCEFVVAGWRPRPAAQIGRRASRRWLLAEFEATGQAIVVGPRSNIYGPQTLRAVAQDRDAYTKLSMHGAATNKDAPGSRERFGSRGPD